MPLQAVVGPVSGYEVNVLFLACSRYTDADMGTAWGRFIEVTQPLRDLLLLTLNLPAQNRTRNVVPVLIGYGLQWYNPPQGGGPPNGIATSMVHMAPAQHDWEFRPVLIDSDRTSTPYLMGNLILHEIGHSFGAITGGHEIDIDHPSFMPRMRAGIQKAISFRR